jgi:hypothetical protein
MKRTKALTLILAFSLLIAPLFIARPIGASPDSSFAVEPFAISPLTDSNASINGLETPASPSPVDQSFEVDLHLLAATGVSGIEVHFYFGNIAGYAIPTGFTDMLGETGGVLTGPKSKLLYGVSAGFYDAANNPVDAPFTTAVYYKAAAASTAAAKDSADDLVAKLTFKITQQPTLLTAPAGFVTFPLVMDFTDIVATSTKGADIQGTLTIDAKAFAYPERAHLFVSPATIDEAAAKVGDTFTVTVSITADAFWDVAGFDITFTYDPTLIKLVSFVDDTDFLKQHGEAIFNFTSSALDDPALAGIVHTVCTKLSDPAPSSGTGSLLQMTFEILKASTSFPAFESVLGLVNTDLASWAHPELSVGPWFGSVTAVDLPFNNSEAPPAPLWSHTTTNGTYKSPLKVAGAAIDLYDQYPDPYGGQGPNKHSDAFMPQDLVVLYSKVTFGGDKITNKLAVFEIDNAQGEKIGLLQNYTNENGVATVSFRIPMKDLVAGEWDTSIFGWWTAIATVDVDGAVWNDTMAFQVGWLAQIIGITANDAPYLKYQDSMSFTATLKTISEQTFAERGYPEATASIDAYDTSSYPIGEVEKSIADIHATRNDVNGPGGTTDEIKNDIFTVSMSIPSWTRIGTETVTGYVLSALPSNGGIPFGPQLTPATQFTIKATP